MGHAVALPACDRLLESAGPSRPHSLLCTTRRRRWVSAPKRCSSSAELARAGAPGALAVATAEGVEGGVALARSA